MTYLTPLTNTPLPELPTGPVHIPAHLRSQTERLETFTIPRFASVAARDAVMTALTPGQYCEIVGSGLMKYTGAGWVRMSEDDDIRPGMRGTIGNSTVASSNTLGSWEQIIPAPGSSLPVIVPAGVPGGMRLKLEATFHLKVNPIGSTSVWFMADGLMMGGPGGEVTNPLGDQHFTSTVSYVVGVPTPGTHYYTVRVRNNTAASWAFAWGQLTATFI